MGCTLCVDSNKSEQAQNYSTSKRSYEISLYSLGFLEQIGTPTQTQKSQDSSSSIQDSFLDEYQSSSFENMQIPRRQNQIQQRQMQIISSNNNNSNQFNQPTEDLYEHYKIENKDQDIYSDRFNFSGNYYERQYIQNDQSEL
ncbi:hypothetical protein TTHERM_00189000 (macronuclear) [Tetrahymena thermophila SB210]|uniref:Uncharacterized protein n=1 Tax=Tetrahymena thermophila (strain SB210) TaxID=312017 RepID=I7M7Z7_TETTS|nr:hypothetical protein TTHERM_00189000 [Tetrahymena thermophila SB210]EAR96331.1 hypothetical protein TTHERM_00189000 [Tetrahymena thermophila SB210]|eukprot:XP_001016576.1 hypothetical protein TTHERM_00189000 [Tetrahymena thermophila SB210]